MKMDFINGAAALMCFSAVAFGVYRHFGMDWGLIALCFLMGIIQCVEAIVKAIESKE